MSSVTRNVYLSVNSNQSAREMEAQWGQGLLNGQTGVCVGGSIDRTNRSRAPPQQGLGVDPRTQGRSYGRARGREEKENGGSRSVLRPPPVKASTHSQSSRTIFFSLLHHAVSLIYYRVDYRTRYIALFTHALLPPGKHADTCPDSHGTGTASEQSSS